MKIKYFYSIYGELEEKLYSRISYGEYVYILNISGSDVCKIGHTRYIFTRIKQIRNIVKSVFPFIENSITYNVYISSPLKDADSKRALESELHTIFRENNLDGEWFKCDFNTVINTLREREFDYIDVSKLKYSLSIFDDKVYKRNRCFNSFNHLQYLKSFQALEFKNFLKHHYPGLLDQNKHLSLNINSSATEEYLINILKNFSEYIKCIHNKSNYKKDVTERINKFISEFNISE